MNTSFLLLPLNIMSNVVTLINPKGVEVDVLDSMVDGLLAKGYTKAEAKKPAKAPKAKKEESEE